MSEKNQVTVSDIKHPKIPKLYEFTSSLLTRLSLSGPFAEQEMRFLCRANPKKLENSLFSSISYVCHPLVALLFKKDIVKKIPYSKLKSFGLTSFICNPKSEQVFDKPFWAEVKLVEKEYQGNKYFPYQLNQEVSEAQLKTVEKIEKEHNLEEVSFEKLDLDKYL
jgi:hypothetical protein